MSKKYAAQPEQQTLDYEALKVRVADEHTIRSWSYGEVKKPETINYRTLKPERDGLFCSRIFGPMKDFECLCGKYKRSKFKGVVCEKCGVEVTTAKVRRSRMGHIELASPVAHVWFTRSLPSRIGLLLDLNMKDIEKVIYYENYIVVDPGLTNLQIKQLLTDEEYLKAQDEFGESGFEADLGAAALKKLLKKVHIDDELEQLKQEMIDVTSEVRRRKLSKRIKLFEAFKGSGIAPDALIITVLPVIPPDLRPLVALPGGRFASSDLNDLYRRVINRNNRLKRLIELHAPEIIIRNERRMLQESVDALFDNGRRGRAILGSNKRPLKSLSDMLKGKQGRFRQNLLGKRVDYSGRSVIVVGPELKLYQCGIPKNMAIELLRPFIYSRLVKYGLTPTLKTAKRLVERAAPEVWDVLEQMIRQHPVLLNRAPTLHRLGIQAFEPVLVEGKAIQLHPLVCTAFNADFDGDQMAVHVPLSLEARLEARILMLSTNNILSPSSGEPITVPTKDIVLGLYYLSMSRPNQKGEGALITSLDEAEHQLLRGDLTLHTRIKARIPYYQADGSVQYKVEDTTPGRLIIQQYMPKHHELSFDLINRVLISSDIQKLVRMVYNRAGQKETVVFVDKIMMLGFKYVTKAGISFSKADLIIPSEKEELVEETKKVVGSYEQQFLDGLITSGEKYNKAIDAWTRCADQVAEKMMDQMSKVSDDQPVNSVYMMAHSKARGSRDQMKQLAGMRGLMSKPSGEILETPVISNFKEGLNVMEYFISTHGSRKGLADAALKTANSGYLTRRLVDVAQDCIITEPDCGTTDGLHLQGVSEGANSILPLFERILGRVAQGDIKDARTGEIVVHNGDMITEDHADLILDSGISSIKVRTVLLCKSLTGICAKCYGRDLGRGHKINIGEAVGIIAAQSIGEPGTQLTLRTFHVGGAAQKGAEQSSIEAGYNGYISLANAKTVVNRDGVRVTLSRTCEVALFDENDNELMRQRIPYGAEIYCDDKMKVKAGDRLAKWDPFTYPVIAEKDGTIEFIDLFDTQSIREVLDETTGVTNRMVIDWKQNPGTANLKPHIKLDADDKSFRYYLAVNAIVLTANGTIVKAGDILARMPKEMVKTRDITGGLPRVSELFEARRPKDAAIIAEFNGRVSFGKDYKTKRRIEIIAEGTENDPNPTKIEYMIVKGRYVAVNDGDSVKKGDLIVEGNQVPHDILRIMGVDAFCKYLVDEIQQVYRLHAVPINDKHIEVIVRQMVRKFEITDVGDSELEVGSEIERLDLYALNKDLEANGKPLIEARHILQGITKASLHTKSFLSAASFQETTRVLTEAAISGKIDMLLGLKENVLVGRLIPAGSGCVVKRYKAIDPEFLKTHQASEVILEPPALEKLERKRLAMEL